MEDLELVTKIDNVELTGTGDPPVHYHIVVTGSVPSSGFGSPSLIIKASKPDDDGTLTYYFAATPPSGGGFGGQTKIRAERYLFDLLDVRKLIFVAATNTMERFV